MPGEADTTGGKLYQCACGARITRRENIDNAGKCDHCRELQDAIEEEAPPLPRRSHHRIGQWY